MDAIKPRWRVIRSNLLSLIKFSRLYQKTFKRTSPPFILQEGYKNSDRIMTESLSGKVVDLSSNYYQLFIKDLFSSFYQNYKENLWKIKRIHWSLIVLSSFLLYSNTAKNGPKKVTLLKAWHGSWSWSHHQEDPEELSWNWMESVSEVSGVEHQQLLGPWAENSTSPNSWNNKMSCHVIFVVFFKF